MPRPTPILLPAVLGLVCLLAGAPRAEAQADRREIPRLLATGLAELNIGHIGYPFSQAQLEPGHTAETVDVPNLGVRVSIGRHVSNRLSAQIVYLRPTQWVRYRGINGTIGSRTVWTNVIGGSLVARRPVAGGLAFYGEGGLAVVTRHGFEVDQRPAVEDAVYVAPLAGAGIEYQVRPRWGVKAGLTWVPGRASAAQPRTLFLSTGLTYRVDGGGRAPRRPVGPPPDPQRFRRHLVQVGYTTRSLGYGFNAAMTPIFWQGDAEIGSGLTLHYQRNVFHTERLFSIDWGASFSYGRSRRDGDGFVAVSLYPLFRFTPIRTGAADLYFSYSLAGPTLISAGVLDGHDTGHNFTFQDLLGVGVYAGRDRHLNVEVRIGHYSNGNVLPRNAGIRVPVTLNVGYAF